MSLSDDLKQHLLLNGADLVGFADLTDIIDDKMPTGVSIAIALPKQVVKAIEYGPTMDYYNTYYEINDKLDNAVMIGEEYLKLKGYKAIAQTTDRVVQFDTFRTKLPHKTVATNAGLGWVGKSALLVTEKYGSAVRLSSIITNAKLEYASPIAVSKCGSCIKCTAACPANAITGNEWNVSIDRDEFYSCVDCRNKARELSASKIDKKITLCGKCIEVCPYTQRYLQSF